jgi:hypothetical protein
MALVDCLQQLEGVRVVEFKSAASRPDKETIITAIDGVCTPLSGYFSVTDTNIELKMNPHD